MVSSTAPSLLTRLRDALPFVPASAPSAPDDEEAFERHCAERLPRDARTFAFIVAACGLLWWPTDPIVYHRLPDVIGPTRTWRIGVSSLALLGVVVQMWRPLKRVSFELLLLGAMAGCAVMGWTSGLMGGPDKPFFHFCYVLPFTPVPMPISMGRRVALTLCIVAATLAGFYLPFPAYRGSAYLPASLSFYVCVIAVSLFFGYIQRAYLRANFFQERALGRSARELEARVEARTVELRRLLDYVEQAREDERTRIARELHDELGQELSALRYSLAFARERLESESPSAAKKNLAEMADLLSRTSKTTRNLVADLRPVILDDFGLGAAAEWLVKRTEERTGIAGTLETDGPPGALESLPRELSTAAFRILQESLTNVARHAIAQHVKVRLTVDGEALELIVKDDGVGLGAATPSSAGGGMGLLGMRERAAALGGQLRITPLPLPTTGTEVWCRLPRHNIPGAIHTIEPPRAIAS